MATQVFEVMTRDVLVLDSMARVAEAVRLLTESGVSSAPVVNPDGEYMGVVTCGHVLAFNAMPHTNPRTAQVWEMQSFKHKTVPPTITIREAAKIMAAHNQHSLYVLDGNEIVGVVSSFDITKIYADEDTASKAA